MAARWKPVRAEVVVADGGWSTVLKARGAPRDRPAELANLTHPHLVEQLARDYLEAGAAVLTTNTFALMRMSVAAANAPQVDVRGLLHAGATLARRAAGRRGPAVLGTIGPSGRIVALREIDEPRLGSAFADQATVLADAGVDGIVLETFSELREALAALYAVREATKLPVIVSFSFDSGPQRTRTLMGLEASQAAAALDEAGADVIGMNCGAGAALALPALVALRANTQRPIWVKPSAGPPDLVDGRPVYPQPPEEFAAHVTTWIDAGADFVGGCCGVGPEHIRRVAGVIAGSRRRSRRRGR